MRLSFHSIPLAGLVLALAAACGDRPSAGRPVEAAVADTPCLFTPASATLRPDSAVIFVPGPGCGRTPRKGALTWEGAATPARAGFMGMKEGSCTTSTASGRRVWKVIRCAPGAVRLTIYADTLGTTVLQQIEITDP
jgi:hypothetical protein